MCPYGSSSRSRLGAALGLPRVTWLQHPPSGAGQLRSCHVSHGICGLQANKQISSDDLAIMISIGRVRPYLPTRYMARATPHARKACSRRLIKCR
jgi:hypothetical protein